MPSRAVTAPRADRRRALGALAAASGLPLLAQAATPLPRVAIVGAGMAGMACAWLLDGAWDVSLFEAAPSIGGNVRSIDVDVGGGQSVRVDVGAQNFHPGPYPTYVQLLEQLGLYPAATGGSHAFTASITLDAPAEATPRFVSPILPGRAWPLLAPWNRSGLEAFSTLFRAAQRREQRDASWWLAMADWLPTLGLTPAQIEGIVLPWVASLYSGSIEQARGLSARAAMVYAAKALPPNPLDPLLYYVVDRGMIEPLQRMLAQCSTVQVATATPVTMLARLPQGGFLLQPEGGVVQAFDALVLAASGPPTLGLLQGLPGTAALRGALQGIQFHDARLMIHRDPAYAPAQPGWTSFLNCRVQPPSCEASMDLSGVITPPASGGPPALWKSWVTHRQQLPADVVHDAQFKHMLPTVATLQAQQAVAALQGQGGLWLAGGYLHPFDAQETALLSAMAVAQGLNPAGTRLHTLARHG